MRSGGRARRASRARSVRARRAAPRARAGAARPRPGGHDPAARAAIRAGRARTSPNPTAATVTTSQKTSVAESVVVARGVDRRRRSRPRRRERGELKRPPRLAVHRDCEQRDDRGACEPPGKSSSSRRRSSPTASGCRRRTQRDAARQTDHGVDHEQRRADRRGGRRRCADGRPAPRSRRTRCRRASRGPSAAGRCRRLRRAARPPCRARPGAATAARRGRYRCAAEAFTALTV